MVKAHDEIVDAHEEQAEQIRKLQLKMADLEDRSRQNNLKIRGVPETVKSTDLIPYLQQLFLKLIPDLTPRDLLMNRAHRISKPAHLPDTVPRDVLTRIHFYHIKERLLCVARTAHNLHYPYAGVSVYQDLLAATSQRRKGIAGDSPQSYRSPTMAKWTS